ncbi:MAG: fibronectin type III domain-containing protein [Dehalococcoidia bacterium]|nr:fibronectin type III domain-containing protein [Dehalococcoidia bacterium]
MRSTAGRPYKRAFCLLLTLAMMLTLMPMTAFAAQTITVGSGTTVTGDVFGNSSNASGVGDADNAPTGNTLIINGTVNQNMGLQGAAIGAAANATWAGTAAGAVTGNTVTIGNSGVVSHVRGGLSGNNGGSFEASSNIVTVNGSVNFIGVTGGWSIGGNANGNEVTINGTVNGDVYGGFSETASAGTTTGNTVTINSGLVDANYIRGGNSQGSGAATGNTVVISGGTVNATSISGGMSNSGAATGNTVTISGGTVNAAVYGGDSSGGGNAFTGNILNKNNAVNLNAGNGSTIFSVQNFEFINFGYSGNANISTLSTTPTGATGMVKLDTGVNNITFSGSISGTGGIEKQGTGTLTFSGSNTYTGGTTITAGTLVINGNLSGNLTVSGSGSVTITGTHTGTQNFSGSGTVIIAGVQVYPPPTAPAAPGGFAAAAGDTQVVLTWTTPDNGGSAITKYQISHGATAGYSENWTDISGSGAGTTTHTVTGLTNGTSYTFEVRAVNAVGNGASSGTRTATSLATPTAPAAPGSFTAAAGDAQVVLKWTTPDNGGSAITKYQVSHGATAGYSANWTDISGSGASTATHTVTGLTNGTSYTFEVRAVNAVGNGASSGMRTATPAAPGGDGGGCNAGTGMAVVLALAAFIGKKKSK